MRTKSATGIGSDSVTLSLAQPPLLSLTDCPICICIFVYLYFCVFVSVYFCNRNWIGFRYIVAHWALNMKSDAMGSIFAKQSTAQYAAMVDSVGWGISVMLLPHLRFCICAFAFLYLCICAQRQVCVVQAGYLSCKSARSVLDNPMDHFAWAWAWIWTELVLSQRQNLFFRAGAAIPLIWIGSWTGLGWVALATTVAKLFNAQGVSAAGDWIAVGCSDISMDGMSRYHRAMSLRCPDPDVILTFISWCLGEAVPIFWTSATFLE